MHTIIMYKNHARLNDLAAMACCYSNRASLYSK